MIRPGVLIKSAVIVLGVLVSACTPVVYQGGEALVEPTLSEATVITADGTSLPFRRWLPKEIAPKAILLAIHGFNDYSHYFEAPGTFLAAQFGIASYAIDQRGFGQAPPKPGTWAGAETYANDVKSTIIALKNKHPNLPLYVLGTSMGGGVVMIAMTDADHPEVDGIILSAPAVWGRTTMPWYQRMALWIGAHTFPDMALTGRGLNIKPSDNIPMLIELGKDPLVIKKTRIGTIYGLVNLMDKALERSAELESTALILYGQKDEVIPKKPTALMLAKLPKNTKNNRRIALYDNGYHMLMRDLQREVVWKDIGSWIIDPTRPLPSGADRNDISSLVEKG